ncbi:MAG: (d)CMP kinase [Faecousia sp.]|nr:(d)CMP kinase [Bacillota bacterium]
MTDRIYNVAIDGPAGAGKSTVARRAAAELGFVYVDTGAIYRAVALAVLDRKVDSTNEAAVASLLKDTNVKLQWEQGVQHLLLNGVDVTDRLRSPEVSDASSRVSAFSAVRCFLLETQREVARQQSVIMDGRDIGTVVLPEAQVKLFLTASAATRAERRCKELREKGLEAHYEDVLRDIEERDYRDMHRELAPLRQAEDAVLLDTSALTLAQSIDETVRIIREKLAL